MSENKLPKDSAPEICSECGAYKVPGEEYHRCSFDAYYYGFDKTGDPAIDAILQAVSLAGKGCHHTSDWSEYGYPERIQRAANLAASLRRSAEQSEDATPSDDLALRLVDALYKVWNGCDTESANNRRVMDEAFSRAFNRARNRHSAKQALPSPPDPKHAICAVQFSNGLTGWSCGAPGCGFKTIDQNDMLEHAGSFVVKNVSPSLGEN